MSKSSFEKITSFSIARVRREFATHRGDFVLLNGGILGRQGIDATAGFICCDCKTSFENETVPPSALCHIFSPNYVSDDES
jgi:hypothetical protein